MDQLNTFFFFQKNKNEPKYAANIYYPIKAKANIKKTIYAIMCS